MTPTPDRDEVLVIGIGTRHRGDDEFGLEVARRIPEMPGVTVCEHSGDGLDLLDAWEAHDQVVIVDAVASSEPPGTLTRLTLGQGSFTVPKRPPSSHFFGLQEAIELGRSLDRLPRTLVFLGVTGADFRIGHPMSPVVQTAIPGATRAVLREVGEMSSGIAGPA
jgi:hydrogenase maturation protease